MLKNEYNEWLETDGLGGFASGTVGGVRTRKYHALLLQALHPPNDRYVFVNDVEAWLEMDGATYPLSKQHYTPDVLTGSADVKLESCTHAPWPQWTYTIDDTTQIEKEVFSVHKKGVTALQFSANTKRECHLCVRPLLSGRNYHGLLHKNDDHNCTENIEKAKVQWRMSQDIPSIVIGSNGSYQSDPVWYEHFFYSEDARRGLDYTEDCFSPGIFRWNLQSQDAILLLGTEQSKHLIPKTPPAVEKKFFAFRSNEEKRRSSYTSQLSQSSESYIVDRGEGKTIIAGYPWFTDWGRDTFIAMRGICIAQKQWNDARDILLQWSQHVSEGMLPNRFPDASEDPEYNAVDASLWYIIAVYEYLLCAPRILKKDRATLTHACQSILEGYSNGTRYNIHLDEDGLLAAGEPGVQLTWMDAKYNDHVVTPRIGKPVEVQALWLNALWIAREWDSTWQEVFSKGKQSFSDKFWNADTGYLYDVIDEDHAPGKCNAQLRPNQLFAIGGLPLQIIQDERARSIVDICEQKLWTPMGPRSLSPDSPQYKGIYTGSMQERDEAYHQGTVWSWLSGAFIEAYIRSHGSTGTAKKKTKKQFLDPLLANMKTAGLGHISEITDGDAPHTPRGCPFQAWSIGEIIRILTILES